MLLSPEGVKCSVTESKENYSEYGKRRVILLKNLIYIISEKNIFYTVFFFKLFFISFYSFNNLSV